MSLSSKTMSIGRTLSLSYLLTLIFFFETFLFGRLIRRDFVRKRTVRHLLYRAIRIAVTTKETDTKSGSNPLIPLAKSKTPVLFPHYLSFSKNAESTMLNELNARPDIPFPNLAWFFLSPRMSGLYSEIMSVKSRAENVFAHSNSCASSSSEMNF